MIKLTTCMFMLMFITSCDVPSLGVTSRNTIVSANEFVLQESFKIQREILETKQCPTKIEGWDKAEPKDDKSYELQAEIRNEDGLISMGYHCTDELKFKIFVRYSIDSDLLVTGGFEQHLEVKYGHFSDRKKLIVTREEDVAEIAKILL